MRRPSLLTFAFVFAGGVAAGCSAESRDGAPENGAAIRGIERRAVGRAMAYPAETYTAEDEARFASSKKARRELGWHVLEKVLQPVPIAAQPTAEADAGEAPNERSPKRMIPLFRTWLGGDELGRLFERMYDDLGRDRRLAKQAPSDDAVTALFDWNAQSLGPSSEADYLERLALVQSQQAIDGLAGNARTAYSPGYARQYLTDYAAIAQCDGKTSSFSFDTPPNSQTNHSNCFSREFASDAAVVKASWRRNDDIVTDGLPIVVTNADTLKKRLAAALDLGGWPQKGFDMVKAGPNDAYTVELESGARYSLAALHVATKELRHWVWVTIWWSPDADSDFGMDRPDSIRALGGPWKNYKMCVVTDYAEKDPDPRGGFDGSLGDALAAVHGPETWCSNAFIEKGAHNAGTNCIGCHQHAGDVGEFPQMLTDDKKYPSNARTMVRKSFPADYTWAFATPESQETNKDRLLKMVVDRMKTYEAQDKKEAAAAQQ